MEKFNTKKLFNILSLLVPIGFIIYFLVSENGLIDLINYAKEKIPDVVITSDVIVGFPTETDAEFEDTISLINEVEFGGLFTFIYSV